MSVLSALAVRHTALDGEQVERLHALVGEWQLLADLAFADCLLLAPVRDVDAYVVLAQVRPYPTQTLYPEDLVGTVVPGRDRPKVGIALAERRIVREGDPEWRAGTPIREEVIPVPAGLEAVAALTTETNLASARTPSHLELAYMRAAGDLAQMIADGTFPFPLSGGAEHEVSPRVGDGFVLVGADWRTTYASPNASSAYRRLGVTAKIVDEPVSSLSLSEDELSALRSGRPFENEIEANGAYVLRRFIPIVESGTARGCIGLVRDITELRRRDRMLVLKDATIREIHHRVKNNLQTVASLLRLQARRLGEGRARDELEESVRRISSIAVVHETLSTGSAEQVAFDDVAQRLLDMVARSLVGPDAAVSVRLKGSAGTLSSDVATPLSLIVTELVQNAVEHAFDERGGDVVVTLERDADLLALEVRDDGVGLPAGFAGGDGATLGLQIVRTLAEELRADLRFASDGGTRVRLEIPLAGAR